MLSLASSHDLQFVKAHNAAIFKTHLPKGWRAQYFGPRLMVSSASLGESIILPVGGNNEHRTEANLGTGRGLFVLRLHCDRLATILKH